MGSAGVAEKRAKKEELEGELAAEASPRFKPQAEKRELRERIARIEGEKASAEKRAEAVEEKEKVPGRELAQVSAKKPEKSVAPAIELEGESARLKSATYSSRDEVKGEVYRFESKAKELMERDLEERVREEESAKDAQGRPSGGQRLKTGEGKRGIGGKPSYSRVAGDERIRIRRPPTAAEKAAVEGAAQAAIASREDAKPEKKGGPGKPEGAGQGARRASRGAAARVFSSLRVVKGRPGPGRDAPSSGRRGTDGIVRRMRALNRRLWK
ncbi:MAG: hypothetical protein PHF51_03860 [Candidatus ainarchaeum sp.]|nr:hypothetical protein [Candidatus ainarchaeum sp.]